MEWKDPILYLLSDPSETGQYRMIDHGYVVLCRTSSLSIERHNKTLFCRRGSCFFFLPQKVLLVCMCAHVYVCVCRGLFHPGRSLRTEVIVGMHPTPDLL